MKVSRREQLGMVVMHTVSRLIQTGNISKKLSFVNISVTVLHDCGSFKRVFNAGKTANLSKLSSDI